MNLQTFRIFFALCLATTPFPAFYTLSGSWKSGIYNLKIFSTIMQRNWRLSEVKQLPHVQEICTSVFLAVNTSLFHRVILTLYLSDSVLGLTSDLPR